MTPTVKIVKLFNNKDQLNSIKCFQMLTKLLNTNYPNSHANYTDGYVANNTAGCGIYSSTTKCAIKLPNFSSIFLAEVIAISLAADESAIAG